MSSIRVTIVDSSDKSAIRMVTAADAELIDRVTKLEQQTAKINEQILDIYSKLNLPDNLESRLKYLETTSDDHESRFITMNKRLTDLENNTETKSYTWDQVTFSYGTEGNSLPGNEIQITDGATMLFIHNNGSGAYLSVPMDEELFASFPRTVRLDDQFVLRVPIDDSKSFFGFITNIVLKTS